MCVRAPRRPWRQSYWSINSISYVMVKSSKLTSSWTASSIMQVFQFIAHTYFKAWLGWTRLPEFESLKRKKHTYQASGKARGSSSSWLWSLLPKSYNSHQNLRKKICIFTMNLIISESKNSSVNLMIQYLFFQTLQFKRFSWPEIAIVEG